MYEKLPKIQSSKKYKALTFSSENFNEKFEKKIQNQRRKKSNYKRNPNNYVYTNPNSEAAWPTAKSNDSQSNSGLSVISADNPTSNESNITFESTNKASNNLADVAFKMMRIKKYVTDQSMRVRKAREMMKMSRNSKKSNWPSPAQIISSSENSFRTIDLSDNFEKLIATDIDAPKIKKKPRANPFGSRVQQGHIDGV